jgi:UbiD family decarboxylase
MDLRTFLAELDAIGELKHVTSPTDPVFEVANQIAADDGQPVLFEQLLDYPVWRMVSGYVARRAHFARAIGCEVAELMERMNEALAQPSSPPVVETAPCQEVTMPEVDLRRVPIPRYHPLDGGPYVTAGVAVVRDPDLGQNLSYHRLLQRDETHFVARIVEKRGTHTAWQKQPEGLPLAVCIGLPPHVLLAAAMSPAKGVDEAAVAHALAPTPLVRAKTVPLDIPAQAELVLEGVLTHELDQEGPFPDLTGTMDSVRQQPVFRVTAITHRRDPIFHALLPAGLEHKNLMGMPREPTILAEVNNVARCTGVSITPGGCSWLHAVVQIEKQGPEDARRAIEAAFRGHSSLKHVVVVDTDVDIYDPHDVEWAIATRFQASTDLVIFRDQPSSSLDPSARQVPGKKAQSDKLGIDATIPWDTSEAGYTRVTYKQSAD